MSDAERRRRHRGQSLLSRSVLPRCDELRTHPELASLAVLETAADVAILSLGAVYPELAVLDIDDSPELRAALDIIDLARAIASAVKRYRLELLEAHERDDDLLPF